MRQYLIPITAVIWLFAGPAMADPKTIILDGCAKVETEVNEVLKSDFGRQTVTVKCTGVSLDPKVRESYSTLWGDRSGDWHNPAGVTLERDRGYNGTGDRGFHSRSICQDGGGKLVWCDGD